MSDPQWPDLSSPFSIGDGEQQSQDSTTPSYTPSQAAPSPYGLTATPTPTPTPTPVPAQPVSPFGPPNDPGQPGQYGQYGQQLPAQAPNPYEQSGYSTGYPANPYEQTGGATYPTSPYGQPAVPSRPISSYPLGELPVPSAPPVPFARPSAPSRPLLPNEQRTPPTPSRPLTPPSQSGPPAYAPAPQVSLSRGRSLARLWIALGVLAVLIAGGGAFYVVGQVSAPATVATQFCDDLKAQSYGAAYTLLSSSMRAQFTQDQFVRSSQALDQLEGQVTACQPSTSGSGYHYSFGATTATVAATISRNKQSSALTGALRLASEGGAWKVSGVDTALLGVSLGAIRTTITFCSAAKSKDYATATSLSDSALQVAQSDWATWDQIGGTISTCDLQGLGSGNTDSAASIEVSVSRASGGSHTGAIGLTLKSGAWKVSKLDAGLIGPDLGPLKVGTLFCQDILRGNYADAYGLLSSGAQHRHSKDDFTLYLTLPSGLYWSDFTPRLSTYKVSGTAGGYQEAATIAVSNGGVLPPATLSLSFVQGSDGAWKVDGYNTSLS